MIQDDVSAFQTISRYDVNDKENKHKTVANNRWGAKAELLLSLSQLIKPLSFLLSNRGVENSLRHRLL